MSQHIFLLAVIPITLTSSLLVVIVNSAFVVCLIFALAVVLVLDEEWNYETKKTQETQNTNKTHRLRFKIKK